MKKFYYDRQKLGKLLLLNTVLVCAIMFYILYCPCYLEWAIIVAVLATLSFSISAFIAVFPPRVALIDKDGLIIDRNAKLLFKDIKSARKLDVRALFFKRAIIRLEPKKGKGKPWRLMQYVSNASAFGAYSIPLYAMRENDAKAIEKELAKHIAIQK